MTKNTTKYDRHLDVTALFGYRNRADGSDFSRSIYDRTSRLYKIIHYLRGVDTPVSRRNLLGQLNGNRNRSSHAIFFAGMVKAGFVEKVGRGSRVRYIEGKNSTYVVR